MTSRLFAPLVLCALFGQGQAGAEDAPQHVAIGYVALDEDPRYANGGAYTGIEYRTLGRPSAGAELGIADGNDIGRFAGLEFSLVPLDGADTPELAANVRQWMSDAGASGFVVADLPPGPLLELADALADLPVLLLNVSAAEDALRGEDCRANVAHVIPSQSMRTDALMQYLVEKGWTRILALVGPADAGALAALERSAARFGAEVVAQRRFELGTDPRNREMNNVALLTAGEEYDVVYVADASGEFARYVPYQTVEARPVVGDAGLMPLAWHWSWYRHGAPQLQHRFEALVSPRRMNEAAWAAWVAVQAVVETQVRVEGGFAAQRAFLLSDALNLDGAKGNPMSFRDWDQQLRQPILLATADAVIARAPFQPFLHHSNVLDTLGFDAPESRCRLSG